MNEEKFLVDDAGGVKEISVESKDTTLESTPTEMSKPEKKKRGRPAKTKVLKEYRCATCREYINEVQVDKRQMGDNRWSLFCPNCQFFLGFDDQMMQDKVNLLINKNNPK